MVSPLVSRPQCMWCFRRMAGCLGELQFLAGQHIRGKKKLAKVSTVKVHLLQNVPGYGRRGAIVPVTAGVMRNIWYPKRMAEYLTAVKLQELGVKKDLVLERDSSFRSNTERRLNKAYEKEVEKEQEQQRQQEQQQEQQQKKQLEKTEVVAEAIPSTYERATPIELELLSPEEATAILERLLPANLEFYRSIISLSSPQAAKRTSPSILASSAVSAAAIEKKESEKSGKSEKISIYGSVSTGDIAANLKAVLAEDDEGARVVLSPEEITFVDETEDAHRVKHLGVFEIEIKLTGAGATDLVRRTIMVSAQD